MCIRDRTKYGGMMDSEAAVEMFRFWFEELPKYAPPKAWEIDFPEAHTAFGVDGNYALLFPCYCWWTMPWNSPESPIAGKWWYAPEPVDTRFWKPGMPRGYIDPSGWVISAYTKHPEAAFLFAAFMTSKAVDLKKSLACGTPIRWSSVMSDKFGAKDKELGGVVTLMREQMWEQCGTDLAVGIIYPQLLSVVHPVVSDCFQKKLTPEETAKRVAQEIDKWLEENGWLGKKVF